MESGPRGSKDAEEDASLCMEDGAYVEAEGAYNGDMGESVERATLFTCGRRTTMVKAGNYGAMNTTSRVGGSFGTCLPETSKEGDASIIEACVIKDELGMKNDIQTEVVTNVTSMSDGAETLPTPVLENSAVGRENPREAREMEGGSGKAGNRDDNKENEEASSGQR